MTKAYLHVHAL